VTDVSQTIAAARGAEPGPAAAYGPRSGVFDEMIAAGGAVRAAWRPFVEAWDRLGPEGQAQAAADARRHLAEAGLSFNPYVEDARGAAGGWRFDAAPVVLSADDWRLLSEGAAQRARMIEAALHDVYGPQKLLTQGLIPPAVAMGGPAFIPAAMRWDRPPRRRLFRYAVDVARRADGTWVVLDDLVDRADGDGWALANRVALGQAASELFVETGARRLASHFDLLQQALEAETGVEGRMAYVTPGPSDPAYFSAAYLSRYMGLTLVEPGDLAVRDGEAHIKTLEGLRRVDVILRGAPSTGIDPLYAPGLGAVAPPGILRAARLGRLVFANAVGAGVFEGRALAPFSAALIERLTGETPLLTEAPCLWLGDPEARATWAADPDAWRVTALRAASRPGAPVPGPLAGLTPQAAERLVAREGWRMVARAPVATGATPCLNDGRLEPGAWAMRLFVVAGPDGWRTMPGGLAFATSEAAITGLPWGGAAKDVWIVDDPAARASQPAAVVRLNQRRRTAHMRRTGRDLLSRVADDLFWLGRYVERGDATLRVLKVVIERMIDAPRRDAEPELLHRLLSLRLGEPEIPPENTVAALRERIVRLALDPAEPESAPRAIEAIYWNANRTRAHLSRDAWRDVGALHADPVWRTPPEPHRALSLGGAVEEAVRRLSAFAGASHENMTRNFAWRFLELGRRLSRGLHTVAMFRALLSEAHDDEPAALYALLLICDSFFAYRARYLTTPEATPAIDLLILDESNPRSLAWQIARAEEVLDQLPRSTPYRNPEHRLALKLLTDLRISDAGLLGETDAEGRRAALIALLDEAEETLTAISDQVSKAYFAHAEPALTEVSAARLEGLR
jgi:uncharacterized circularly permuted ATP-grasp superfamily protein/uncharacterized alpha-E superfamily protein